jgi:uncharacterized membrane protein
MTYNIHPIFVHFPIALLFIYSIIKVLPLKKWLPSVSWRDIERVLLFFGILGAFASLSTGEIAENMTRSNHSLVNAHSLFAIIATWIYGLLLIGEFLSILMPWATPKIKLVEITKIATFLNNILIHPLISKILAILGLITISITGLLGGVMVYGVSADPFASLILKLLGIQF